MSDDGFDLLRQSRQMSVERLAQIVGASSAQIEKYETGTARVSAVDLLRIAVALDQTVAYFFQDARAAVAAGQSPALETLLPEDAIELLRAFANVRDPSARRTIIALTISLAKQYVVLPHLLDGSVLLFRYMAGWRPVQTVNAGMKDMVLEYLLKK